MLLQDGASASESEADRNRIQLLMEEAVEALSDGFVLYDSDRRLVFANKRYAEMLGPHKDLLVPGARLDDIVGSAVRSGHISFVRSPEGGLPGVLETLAARGKLKIEIKVADGSQHKIYLKHLKDGSIVVKVRDITEQRTAEARAREILYGAVDAVDVGIALIDDDDRLVFANKKFREIGDPDGRIFVPGRAMRDIHGEAIACGLIPLPGGMNPAEMLDELDRLIRLAIKGYPIPNNQNRELVGSAYETNLKGRLLTIEDVTDRVRAERRFTTAVERLPVGIAFEGPDGQFTHCNDAFAAPFHLTAAEILRLSDIERIDLLAPQISMVSGQEVGDRAAELFTAAVKQQRETLEPMEVRFWDGRHYRVERAISEHNSRVVVVTDITALKETEARSLATLNDAIQSLDEGLVLFDKSLNFVLGNRLWYEMYFSELAPPVAGENILTILGRLIDNGVVLVPEGEDKTSYMCELTLLVKSYQKKQAIHLAGGRILLASAHRTELDGYLVSFIDVTEQRRAEEEQREADLLLHKIVEACPANFLVSRIEDGKIIYCPPASRERFGDIDTTLNFFLKPEDRERYLEALLPTGTLDDYRVQFRRADGSIMEGITAARVTDYKGENVIVSSTRDISDLLAMQEELQKQRDIAHQNEKLSALGELLAGVAHELNNPLSIVTGYAQMLQGKLKDPVLEKRIDRIAEAADRSARIVRAFLSMARQRPANLEPCTLNEIASVALDLAGYGLRSNGARIETEFDEDLPSILGDTDQLVQVVTNLIINAEHALSPLGENAVLVLRTFNDGRDGEAVLEVRDNGPGMTKEIRDRIFEPFFTTKDVGEGTGVGLAFCHRVVDTHEGTLEVSSSVGKGTSFFVRLPAMEIEASTDASQAQPGGTHHRKRVLVVDDDVAVSELVCDLLADLGCQAIQETSARKALARLSHTSVDLIISDYKMPGMDGAAFYNSLIGLSPGYKDRIAFMTGDAMGKSVQTFLMESDRPYIEKPISKKDLACLLNQLDSRKNTS
ncbi:PAS-domain containing protein [Roseibium sp.]|uniref:hybrid sensor histidine kinase/response regulator n=1 Tax=Roseibium sp. TaxID=1936156 RepID=UPI001B19ECBF|nr:PAS-domain containing protein [Roseibium sp.]MBO6856098.1 PAS-domain containing protein [Roseibium sp.]